MKRYEIKNLKMMINNMSVTNHITISKLNYNDK